VAEVQRLGRYSLFSYIAQIAVLQVLHRLAFRGNSSFSAVCLTVMTLVLTWSAVWIVEVLRRKSRVLNVAYRATFG
jgi:peptidoglycan/LPS O-acetylase OafA/YrhL